MWRNKQAYKGIDNSKDCLRHEMASISMSATLLVVINRASVSNGGPKKRGKKRARLLSHQTQINTKQLQLSGCSALTDWLAD